MSSTNAPIEHGRHVRLRVDAGLGCALSIGCTSRRVVPASPSLAMTWCNCSWCATGPAMVVVPSLLRMIDIPTKEAEQCSPTWPSILMT
jgi:hypothetical protein